MKFYHFFLTEIDSEEMEVASDTLQLVDLRNNPLTPSCHTLIKNVKNQLGYNVLLSEREIEDWEKI